VPNSRISKALDAGWLIVTGGAHQRGGQDRANLELIRYLSTEGTGRVDVVVHEVTPELESFRRVHLSRVARPLGSTILGERLLEAAASRLQRHLDPSTIVLANGGNYRHAGVNWVHSVHAVWPVCDDDAPVHRRLVNRLKKADARRRERTAVGAASVVIANSERTADDLTRALGVSPDRIAVVRFGSDPAVPSDADTAGSERLVFVGALGWDRNKGLDVALQALQLLVRGGDEKTTLTVAGPGTVEPWVAMTRRLGLEGRVHFVGAIDDVPALLRTADLLVSPVRYEAYGLAIQEALVHGVPALVSANAGIVPLLRASAPQLVVPDGSGPAVWAEAIAAASRNSSQLRSVVAQLGANLAQRTWTAMASELVEQVDRRLLRRD